MGIGERREMTVTKVTPRGGGQRDSLMNQIYLVEGGLVDHFLCELRSGGRGKHLVIFA